MKQEKKPFKITRIHNKLLLITNRGTIAGFLRYHFYDDGSGKRNVEVGYLSVQKRYRRKGYGTALLKRFLEIFKNKVYITLWTGKELEKTGGYTIYEKCGFMQVLVLNDYYDDGVATRMFAIKNNESVKFKKKNKPL